MANFVLMHGAWHGGWCWQRVTALLHDADHAWGQRRQTPLDFELQRVTAVPRTFANCTQPTRPTNQPPARERSEFRDGFCRKDVLDAMVWLRSCKLHLIVK